MSESGLLTIVRSWARDSELFVREALGIDSISNQQVEACKELSLLVNSKIKLADGEKMTEREKQYARKVGVSIMSGQGTGKDAWTSWMILWFLGCFPWPKIGATAPTQHQLKDVLWSEIGKWMNRRRPDGTFYFVLRDFFVLQSDRLFLKETEGKRWFAVARTTNAKGTSDEQAETLAGLHEDFMMLVVDEASGVPDPVFRPFEGTMTQKCNFGVLIFNPTRSTGFAVNTQLRERERWICLRWNAEESELVTRDSIADKARKYGKDSNFYRIRVLGLPPTAEENILLPWDWVIDSVGRDLVPLDGDQLLFSIDVGAGGDDTALLRRTGPVVGTIDVSSIADSEQLTGWLLRRILDEEPRVVLIDPIGVGWGVAGNLRARCKMEVLDVNVAEVASDDARFFRLRDELWWRLREDFEHRTITIPDDPVLIAELTAIRYEPDRLDGKIKVESKKDLKKRIESPNRADSLMMTEYFNPHDVRRMKRLKSATKTTGSWRTA